MESHDLNIGMKWHNALVKFLLVLWAIVRFGNAFFYYSEFENKIGGIVVFVYYIATAILLLVAREHLLNFYKDAIKLFMIALWLDVVFVVILSAILYSEGIINSSDWMTLATCWIFPLINYIYYSKRRHLFVKEKVVKWDYPKTTQANPEEEPLGKLQDYTTYEQTSIDVDAADLSRKNVIDEQPQVISREEPIGNRVEPDRRTFKSLLPWIIAAVAAIVCGIYIYSYYSAMENLQIVTTKYGKALKTSEKYEEKADIYDNVAINANLIGSNTEDISFDKNVITFSSDSDKPIQVPLYTPNGGEWELVVQNEDIAEAEFTEDSWGEKTMIEITPKKPGATVVIAGRGDGDDYKVAGMIVFVQEK